LKQQLKNISSTSIIVANYLQNEGQVTAVPALFFLKHCFFDWLSLPVIPVAKNSTELFWTHESTSQPGVPGVKTGVCPQFPAPNFHGVTGSN
jgi:hypothetical protein